MKPWKKGGDIDPILGCIESIVKQNAQMISAPQPTAPVAPPTKPDDLIDTYFKAKALEFRKLTEILHNRFT